MQRTPQKVVLDSCVVIDIMEKSRVANRLKSSLRGKPIVLILCDVVLDEVQRVRGFSAGYVTYRISRLVGKRVEVSEIDAEHRAMAELVTAQYVFCHRGDNLILALCRTKDHILLTFDRMLLRACEAVGIVAFHPSGVGGI